MRKALDAGNRSRSISDNGPDPDPSLPLIVDDTPLTPPPPPPGAAVIGLCRGNVRTPTPTALSVLAATWPCFAVVSATVFPWVLVLDLVFFPVLSFPDSVFCPRNSDRYRSTSCRSSSSSSSSASTLTSLPVLAPSWVLDPAAPSSLPLVSASSPACLMRSFRGVRMAVKDFGSNTENRWGSRYPPFSPEMSR